MICHVRKSRFWLIKSTKNVTFKIFFGHKMAFLHSVQEKILTRDYYFCVLLMRHACWFGFRASLDFQAKFHLLYLMLKRLSLWVKEERENGIWKKILTLRVLVIWCVTKGLTFTLRFPWIFPTTRRAWCMRRRSKCC